MFIATKLKAVENRMGMNIKSGRVLIEVKDRDWLLSTVQNLMKENEELKKKVDNDG